ncbi:hypothetical protein IVB40_20780 [Bradyrhizobium sp. 40]|uniref:hypothetical protein n=1 Tax=Bradyrhizobium sp. 40 TaxID=2782674 RepID=UPI001FFFA7BE|nr:hypothetical protein [Bradyrhizobium sp. 40]UPJ39775.1 hypothetical protein IVB40_20780 [Bradyrhizobium sp. 40]
MTDASGDEHVKLTLGQAIDQVITALGAFKAADQQTILRAVYAHLNISGPGEVAGKRQEPPQEERAAPPPPRAAENEYSGMDIKTFKELKNPSSARQMACVVAYYLAEIATGDERKEVITIEDIEKYFKQGRFALPTKLEQLLIDCRGAGYFESAARGAYKLTRVGHNLVAHQLPGKGKS